MSFEKKSGYFILKSLYNIIIPLPFCTREAKNEPFRLQRESIPLTLAAKSNLVYCRKPNFRIIYEEKNYYTITAPEMKEYQIQCAKEKKYRYSGMEDENL